MVINQRGYVGEPEPLAMSAAITLDPRLAEVWQLLWSLDPAQEEESGGVPLEAIGGLLRLAYLQGYFDASSENVPGTLFAELGVREPESSMSRRASARRPRRGRGRSGSSGT